jgi:hypothetical protein
MRIQPGRHQAIALFFLNNDQLIAVAVSAMFSNVSSPVRAKCTGSEWLPARKSAIVIIRI